MVIKMAVEGNGKDTFKGCQEATAFASYWIRCGRCTALSRYLVKFLLFKGNNSAQGTVSHVTFYKTNITDGWHLKHKAQTNQTRKNTTQTNMQLYQLTTEGKR